MPGPLPSSANCLRLDFFQAQGIDQNIINRIFFQFNGATPTQTQLVAFCNSAMSDWAAIMSPRVPALLELRKVHATVLTSVTSGSADSTVAPVFGTGAAGSMAALGTAIIIKFAIGRRYRGGHPRWYQAGIEAAQLAANGSVDPATGANMATSLQSMINTLVGHVWTGGSPMTHVNLSYYNGFTVSAPPGLRARNRPTLRAVPFIDPVLGYSFNPLVGSQRRRNRQSA